MLDNILCLNILTSRTTQHYYSKPVFEAVDALCDVTAPPRRQQVVQLGEVAGNDVTDVPRDGLGLEDDLVGDAGMKEKLGEYEVGEELHAGVVQNDVDAHLKVI